MKSLAELEAIKERTLKEVSVWGPGGSGMRVVVGLATCGIAAGARPVYDTLVKEVSEQNLSDRVTVTQTGCIGICQYEPVVEVLESGKEKVTYVKMDAEKAKKVVEEHLKGGNIVTEYTIGAYKPAN